VSDFRSFELAGWSNASTVGAYDDGFGSVTSQAVPVLLDVLRIQPGQRLLDVACGPGYGAAAAAQRGAIATGIDFSPTMVGVAKARHPGIEFREGDAQALPFPDGSFAAVVSSFGLLHFADPDAALREACRVLAPGGRFAFSVWATPDAESGMGIIRAAIEEHGDLNAPLPSGPPQFRFGDPDESRRSLEAAGFRDVETRIIRPLWHAADAEALLSALEESSVRMQGLLRAQRPEVMAAIRGTFAAAVTRFAVDGGVAVPMPALIAVARKP
jgi:SAM-dependent methyltransferase